MPARRAFLRRFGGLLLGGTALAAIRLAAQQQEPLAGRGETGALRDPGSAGRPQERKTARDNDEFVTAVEHRLQCTCGCTLDIYTCRTTDFTCTYSPALHKEVLALQEEGKTADEIVAAFVAKYGEKVLMAPKPEGFNIAGYVVPGSLILLVGGAMFLILRRRTRVRAGAAAAAPATSVAEPGPSVLTAAGGVPDASPDELERLNRELRELDG
jgi:cytochrome c-type biogenesis protein CcmH/NrfF